ncbi:hypothetical protein VTO42DRAFT_4528 [Malbranchea cinnamomea]
MRRYNRNGMSALAGRHGLSVSDPMALIRAFDSETNPSRPIRPSPLAASQIHGMPLDVIDRIRSFPLFQSTPETFLVEIGLHLRPQLNNRNDYILTEGDEAKAMYWLVRGVVAVTSRDGESVYAELKPGAFFGEIGILMDRPRTATIIARTRCLLVVLSKEDFRNILPKFPEVEKAIRDEAEERLQILEKKKKKDVPPPPPDRLGAPRRTSKRVRDDSSDQTYDGDADSLDVNAIIKRRKSPSPGVTDKLTSSALANGLVNVRMLLKELPLFASLPPDILHFLGLNAQPRTFPPFTDIIRQDSYGREIYFIVRGEVEVLYEKRDPQRSHPEANAEGKRDIEVKARLRQGQYFGEVVSLSLAPRRTATVRTVTSVECLMISGEVLSQFWERCPRSIREQVEETARKRLVAASDGDVVMEDAPAQHADLLADGIGLDETIRAAGRRQSMPMLTFSETELESLHKPSRLEDGPVLMPSDPDPFLSVDMDNLRSRSRRSSLAPIAPEETEGQRHTQQQESREPLGSNLSISTTPLWKPNFSFEPTSRPPRDKAADARGTFPDSILVSIFQYLELHHLLRLRVVSRHWRDLLTKSPQLLHYLDLSRYNKKVTDDFITNILCPFIGDRPRVIDLNNCFHVTDEGFIALANACGGNIRVLKMKSVWDVTALAILQMADKAKELQEIDLSNCRKVSDTLLTRIVGWLVPGTAFNQTNGTPAQGTTLNTKGVIQTTTQTPSGSFFGCPYLKRLTLSYCKHVTDRSMHHIAAHAASRLEEVDLTRCTTITDLGFQYWGNVQFSRLRRLCLADCTYLTDNAIVYLTNAAKGLQELDLSFCCALSDTATEVLALGCPKLTHLNLSFCGSAVSDPSLRSIGLHLILLRELSVRGCVRVTGAGVESVMEGCEMLELFDVSQCKNLEPWLQYGYHRRYGNRIRHETVSRNGQLVR